MNLKKKTKIIATLGPSVYKEELIIDLIKNGVNAIRINLSHGNETAHKESVSLVKNAFSKLKNVFQQNLINKPFIIFDTRGPELRTGNFQSEQENKNKISKNDYVSIITNREILGKGNLFSVNLDSLIKKVKKDDLILIDDGKLHLKVVEISFNKIICQALNSHILKNKRKVNLPDIDLDLPFISTEDAQDLLLACKEEVDYIAASFVRNKVDLISLRNFLDKNGGQKIKIIAKIESKKAIENLESIVDNSDAIMIARGDLSVELPFYKLPIFQEEIIKMCKKKNKEVIVATQMLERMITSLQPTNAEIIDVHFAIKLKANWVMLSGETAAGEYPLETVKAMTKIICSSEDYFNEK